MADQPQASRVLSEDEYNRLRDAVISAAPQGLKEDTFQRYFGPAMEQALGYAENTPSENFLKPEGDTLSRAVAGAWETVVGTAKGLWNAAPIPQAMGGSGIIQGPLNFAKSAALAHLHEAQEAWNAYKQGRVVEGVGHTAAAALPLIGPAAAQIGERIAQTGDVAGGVGATATLVAPSVVSAAMRARAASTSPEILTRQAETQVAQKVLGPGNPKYRGTAAYIAPEILKRGLEGGRDELRQLAAEGMDDAGKRIDDAVAAAGGTKAPVPGGQVRTTLEASIRKLQDSNGNPLSSQAAQRISLIRERLAQLRSMEDANGKIRYDDLKKFRDEQGDLAEKAGAFLRQGNPILEHEGYAANEARQAVRQTFATRSGAQAGANADFSFWKDLDEVLDPVKGRPKSTALPTGVTGGARTAGAVTGQIWGGRFGAFVQGEVIPWLREHRNSPKWQLADAKTKMRLADAIRRGDEGSARSAMIAIAPGASVARESQ